ncbi:MAG: CAP domain-containing protein [Chlorobiaceae bacterium]|nr:CAP domain-containing protein [Chlorobiaceae bacterium]
MTTSDFEVVKEINRMRTDPAGYARKYLIPRTAYYRGNSYTVPGKITIIANEGVSALDECIRELLNSTPASSLSPSKGLTLAARDQVNDQASTGKTGHAGSDGSSVQTRIERYGQWELSAAENISYGPVEASEIVISLLIDDGVPSRGHRKNLLNGIYNVVGVKTGTHPVYGAMCVMDFAGNYILKP